MRYKAIIAKRTSSAHKIHEKYHSDKTFSLKGMKMLSFRNSLIIAPLVKTMITRSNTIEKKSIVRSMITVPTSLSTGIFSFFPSVTQRVISPILGKARLAIYPIIIA